MGKQRIRTLFLENLRENCSWRAAENVAVEIPQTFPGVTDLPIERKKSLHNNDMFVAEQEIFELTIRFQQIAL
jgi:hypothetical protein